VSELSRISQFRTLTLDKGIMLRGLARAASRYSSQASRIGGLSMLIAFAALALTSTPVNAKDNSWKYHQMNLKLHAINIIDDWDQAMCFIELIHRESSWNYKAKNGSHYGLGQMRSTWYRDLDPFRQIEVIIKYYEHRYGSPCEALDHSKRKGWT
jgi:hypothetical protein